MIICIKRNKSIQTGYFRSIFGGIKFDLTETENLEKKHVLKGYVPFASASIYAQSYSRH